MLESGPPFYERLFEVIAELADGDEAVALVGHGRAQAVRQRFRDELRGLPAELLSEPMPQSPGDGRVRTAYVQLSVAYAAIADQAQAAGWPVARYSMDHLAPPTRPREVADAIADSLTAAGAAE